MNSQQTPTPPPQAPDATALVIERLKVAATFQREQIEDARAAWGSDTDFSKETDVLSALTEAITHLAAHAELQARCARLEALVGVAKCPECDGSGIVVEMAGATEYVSREMALDAGDPSLEGSVYREPEPEARQCQFCGMRADLLAARTAKEAT